MNYLKTKKTIFVLLFIFLILQFTVPVSARYLTFKLTVNPSGEINRKSQGFYFILFNSDSRQLINATDNRTCTDFICFNGINFTWYHRRTDPIDPIYFIWEPAGLVNSYAYFSPDNKQIIIRFDTADPSIFINQYLTGTDFAVHVVTTDSTSRLKIDALGPGPDLSNNSIFTIKASKEQGVIFPVHSFYPFDLLDDTQDFKKLSDNFPYNDFDIASFEIIFE